MTTKPTPLVTVTQGDREAGLNEFDKIEWRDVSRQINPNISDEQFEADWAEFVALKLHRRTN